MTAWSTPAMLLLGIAVGPYGLELLSPSLLSFLDPGISMALAMLGAFVGLSFNPRQPHIGRVVATSAIRTLTIALAVGGAAFAASVYWLDGGPPVWVLPLVLGLCAAVSDITTDAAADDVLMIVAGVAVVGAIREPVGASVIIFCGAIAAIAIFVAIAGWLLVGQTASEAEQHVFVVGALLLAGGAATYLSLSSVFAGLVVGIAWNMAGGVAKARITRDLHYFQHPLVVLILVSAGAGAALSLDVLALGVLFIAVRALSRAVAVWVARRAIAMPDTYVSSLVVAGLVGVAIALDVFRTSGGGPFDTTILGAVVVGTIGSSALELIAPPQRSPA